MLFYEIGSAFGVKGRKLPVIDSEIDRSRAEILPEIHGPRFQILDFYEHRNLRAPTPYRKGPRKCVQRRKSRREQYLRIKAGNGGVKEEATHFRCYDLHVCGRFRTAMIGVITVNVVMVLLALGIAGGFVPPKMFGGMVGVLHKTIGITLPSPEKERAVALIWIVSMILLGDGMLFLLLFLTDAVVKG